MCEDVDIRAFFKAEVRGHMEALYGMAFRLTKSQQDAEDLVADTLTKAWAALDQLADPTRFKAWMFRILHNTFVSDYRKKRNAPKTESYDENPDDENEDFSLFEKLHQPFLLWWGNPEQEYFNKLLREDISQAIDGLAEQYRIVVMLIDVEGLSYQEAAETLEIPEGTVRSRLKRGRTMLQKSLWKQASDAGLDVSDEKRVT